MNYGDGQAASAEQQDDNVELTPEEFGLDERSVDFVQKLPPEVCQQVLRRLKQEADTIRNPSAFVTKIARQIQAENMRGSFGAQPDAPSDREVLSAEQFGLDERSADFLSQLPVSQSQHILHRLQDEWSTVNNASAFVTKLAKEMQNSAGGGGAGQKGGFIGQRGGPVLTTEQFGLDPRSSEFLGQLPFPQMQHVLRRLQDEWSAVNNPSAFVTKMVKELQAVGFTNVSQQHMQPQFMQRQFVQPQFQSQQYMQPRMQPQPFTRVGPNGFTPEQFGLDPRAAEFVRSLGPELMQQILQKLNGERASVLNPSAFCTRLAKEAQANGGVMADPPQKFVIPKGGLDGEVAVEQMEADPDGVLSPEALGLDDRASEFLRTLPPDQMQEVLERVRNEGNTVRSPSALATRLAKETLQNNGVLPQRGDFATPLRGSFNAPEASASASDAEPLDPEQFGLDDRALEFLQQLPPDKIQHVLQKLAGAGGTVNNPSGFVTRQVKELQSSHGVGPGGSILTPEEFGLDPRCTEFVRSLPPAQMQNVLQRLQGEGDSVTNPSAFVTRIVKQMQTQGGGGGGKGGCGGCGKGFISNQFGGCGGGGGGGFIRNQFGGGAPQNSELTPEQFGLDPRCAEFVRTLPYAQMQQVLERVKVEGNTVFNPSAFVTRLVKEAHESMRGGFLPGGKGKGKGHMGYSPY